MRICLQRVLPIFVVLLVAALPALGQTQTGTINGSVRGPDGDALPGVTVTLTGSSAMRERVALTNPSGDFRFPSLLPGSGYRVAFGLDNFAGVVREGIRVSVGETTTLQIDMDLAEVAAEIVVTGETPMVDVTTATSSTHYGVELLENVPNRRDWSDAVLQTPGMVADTSGGGRDSGQTFSSRGGSVVNNEIAYDGVANTNPVYHVGAQGLITETVAEVQIVNGALPAELGNVAGGYINVVTKSGGNEFQGEGAIYYQDEELQGDNLDQSNRDDGLDTAPAITKYDDFSFNLGGPVARDKAWFNVAYWLYNTAAAVSGFPFDNGSDGDYYFGKFTWQPTENNSLFALYNRSEVFTPYFGADEFQTPEATWQTPNTQELAKVHWTSVLSDSAFLDFDLATSQAHLPLDPQAGAGAAYTDIGTGIGSGGAVTYQDNNTERNQAKAAFSLFRDAQGGSHDFKFGVEWEESTFDWRTYLLSDVYLHQTFSGFPLLAIMSNLPVDALYQMDGLHAYAQDDWSVTDRVTLNLGVRLNTWDGVYPAQSGAGKMYGPNVNFPPVAIDDRTDISWSSFEPRLGINVALDDRGASALRFGLARYHHQLNISYFVLGNPNSLSISVHPWFDLDADLFADPFEIFAPVAVIAGGGSSVDPDLKQPYTDEITIGYERELFNDFSLTVNATYREDNDLIEDISNTPDELYLPTDVTDPGADQEFGTTDDKTLTLFNRLDPSPVTKTITNPEGLERDYRGVELIATKRLSNDWQMLASVVWQQAEGTISNNFASSTGWTFGFDDPNGRINFDGPLGLSREWQFKALGTYMLPLGFSVSGYYQHLSGAPLYRTYTVFLFQGFSTVVADPKDTHQGDEFSRFDLRVAREFNLGREDLNLTLALDAFNLFNENSLTQQNSSTGSFNPFTGAFTTAGGDFGRALEIQAPRVLRLGLRLRF